MSPPAASSIAWDTDGLAAIGFAAVVAPPVTSCAETPAAVSSSMESEAKTVMNFLNDMAPPCYAVSPALKRSAPTGQLA